MTDTNPPVGATVVDCGTQWRYLRVGGGPAQWRTEHLLLEPADSRHAATITTAWRMQQRAEQAEAELAKHRALAVEAKEMVDDGTPSQAGLLRYETGDLHRFIEHLAALATPNQEPTPMTDPREIEALALRIGSAAADWNRYLNSTRGYDPMAPVQSVTDALDTADTALRALATQLTAAQTENTHLRAALAQSKDPCVYCQLPAEEMARCRSGFPGCARADDMAGCPEFGASMEVHSLREQLAAARADVDDETIARAVASVHSPDFAWAGRSTEQRALFARMGRAAINAAKGVRDAKS